MEIEWSGSNIFVFICTWRLVWYLAHFFATFPEWSYGQSSNRYLLKPSAVQTPSLTGGETYIERRLLFDDELDKDLFWDHHEYAFFDLCLDDRGDLLPWQDISFPSLNNFESDGARISGDGISTCSDFCSSCSAQAVSWKWVCIVPVWAWSCTVFLENCATGSIQLFWVIVRHTMESMSEIESAKMISSVSK